MARRFEGAALLVAGHGAIGGTPVDVGAVHTLGQIGEALLATETSWQIRRLSAAAGDRYGADRVALKHHLDELAAAPVRAAVLVILGVLADAGGPALVTSSALREYPEDSTLPLAWIGDRLRACKAERLLVVLSARRAPAFGAVAQADPPAWLAALATDRPDHVVVAAASESGAPVVDAVLAGLCGDALDPATGTVTMKSISAYLARRAPDAAIQASLASQTLASSPPLAGMWGVRRSQLALLGTRTTPRPARDAPDDLAGTVLPGRFQLASVVGRGSFGTVYRARQQAIERDVAVKVLHSDIDPASADGRLFVQEICAVGRLDHGNVVRIFQADITHDGRLFYAMELLDGRDLQQLAAAAPLAQPRALELVGQLLAGLAAAHDAGLIHADVKPANVIVVPAPGPGGGERAVLVDFGVARLHPREGQTEAAGGSPAFMAPEQLRDNRVDGRSDLFSAALVLVYLLTGWIRRDINALVPPLDAITDTRLRAVLARALALDPAERYATARELAAALAGTAAPEAPSAPLQLAPPFRQFASFEPGDALYGRDADLTALTEHVLYRRSVIYTAPSGTGKTSLLRAGLAPRLEALGVHVAYLRCRGDDPAALAAAIFPGATSVAEAIVARGGRIVLVLDQLETALHDGSGEELLGKALGFSRFPDVADVSVVLSIREDHLARLVARAQEREPGIAILRLPPLPAAGARAAIEGPLEQARLAIEPALLDALLADLEGAAAALAPEMGWGAAPAVYPPHLQLACSVMVEALAPGDALLTLAHYRALGGFAAIVGEHLERVLDVELAGGRDAIARDLLVALVTGGHERAVRPEAELLAMVGAKHGPAAVADVLEHLRARGLVVRVRGDAEASWELVHDSLVPRVTAWIDRRDLARRRAIEVVRHHMRRSSREAPSLLSRRELRELRAHDGAVAELDTEWRARPEAPPMMPSALVALSRRTLRRRALAFGSALAAALGVTSVAVVRDQLAEARERAEELRRFRNIGEFELELAPFDWDADRLVATPASARDLPKLHWELRHPDAGDPDVPGELFTAEEIEGNVAIDRGAGVLAARVRARGGPAFLVVSGRGKLGETCAPSVVPLKRLPGYREQEALKLAVPTCAATHAGMIDIPAGKFISGGRGDPPADDLKAYPELAVEQVVELPAFRIDRTETTNAAYSRFGALSALTGIAGPHYPSSVEHAHSGDPDHPVAGISWSEARAYCEFMGKQLPTSRQWERALRGGLQLPDGTPNPMPRRSFPWGKPIEPPPVDVLPSEGVMVYDNFRGTSPVGAHPLDRSPEGVLDLASNVTEWTQDPDSGNPESRVVRGGNVAEANAKTLIDFVSEPNQRSASLRMFGLGMRCVAQP